MKSRQIFVACGVLLAIQLGVLGSLVRDSIRSGPRAPAMRAQTALLDRVGYHQGAPERKTPGKAPQLRANPGESFDIKKTDIGN